MLWTRLGQTGKVVLYLFWNCLYSNVKYSNAAGFGCTVKLISRMLQRRKIWRCLCTVQRKFQLWILICSIIMESKNKVHKTFQTEKNEVYISKNITPSTLNFFIIWDLKMNYRKLVIEHKTQSRGLLTIFRVCCGALRSATRGYTLKTFNWDICSEEGAKKGNFKVSAREWQNALPILIQVLKQGESFKIVYPGDI